MKFEQSNKSFNCHRVSVGAVKFGDVLNGPDNTLLLVLTKSSHGVICWDMSSNREVLIRITSSVMKKGEISKLTYIA